MRHHVSPPRYEMTLVYAARELATSRIVIASHRYRQWLAWQAAGQRWLERRKCGLRGGSGMGRYTTIMPHRSVRSPYIETRWPPEWGCNIHASGSRNVIVHASGITPFASPTRYYNIAVCYRTVFARRILQVITPTFSYTAPRQPQRRYVRAPSSRVT